MTPGSVSGYMILAGAELCLLAAGRFQTRRRRNHTPTLPHLRPMQER